MSPRTPVTSDPVRPRPRLRACRESARYRAEADAIKPDTKRLDEILYGAIWAIEHAAERAGRPTDVPGIRAIPTRAWGDDSPALVIYYSFDAEFADLLSIRKADEADPEDEAEDNPETKAVGDGGDKAADG